MKNKKIRAAIEEYVKNVLDDSESVYLLDNQAYDNSIIGITGDGRLVYSMSSMIEELAAEDGCEWTDAAEWVEYNTLRAVPYMGEKRPIIIVDDIDSILEMLEEEGEEEDDA